MLLAGCASVVRDTPLAQDDGPWGPPTPVDSTAWRDPPKGYLADGATPDSVAIVPAPPAPDSLQGRAERKTYEDTRALAGTPRWIQAQRDADLSGKEAYRGFSCAAGVKIGPRTTPTLATMMLRITDDAKPAYNPAKDLYSRKRPAAGNTAPICVPREDWIETNGSFPSGHSLIGWSWALVLAELVPDRSTQILTRGREFGDSRIICGVHFASDVEAGRTLASGLVARLHADPGFMRDLATAKTELASARRLGPPTGCPG